MPARALLPSEGKATRTVGWADGDLRKAVLFFRFLAILAIVLLWGISLVKDTVKALVLAVYYGKFDDEVDLKVNISVFPIINYPIALLVAFFFRGTDGHDEAYQFFLIDAYSTLQSAFVWLYVEMQRPGTKSRLVKRSGSRPPPPFPFSSTRSAISVNTAAPSPFAEPTLILLKTIHSPIITAALWQCFGAAVALPFYFASHLEGLAQSEAVIVRDGAQAIATPFSFILGAVIPAVIGLAPAWLVKGSRSDQRHQTIFWLWQLDPLWVSLVQAGLNSVIGRWISNNNKKLLRDTYQPFHWTRLSYALAAVSSAIGHLYTLIRLMSSQVQSTNLARMYIPSAMDGPDATTGILVRGPWLFLQYDHFIIGLSSLVWAYIVLTHTMSKDELNKQTVAISAMVIGGALIGPGATVTLALLVREARLSRNLRRT